MAGSNSSAEVTYTAKFQFHGVAKLADPLMGLPLKKLGDDAAESMQRELEKL